jgi:hypothetical protein
MSSALLQRQATLAAVALLGTLAALALSRAGDDGRAATPAVAPRVTWDQAQVSVLAAPALGRESACGVGLTERTIGVAHPVLPCGVVLVLEHDGRRVRAPVVEQGGVQGGVAFELTPALAGQLNVRGMQTIRWRFG